MKYVIDWTLKQKRIPIPPTGEQITFDAVYPELGGNDLDAPFIKGIFWRFWPYTSVSSIPDTALYRAVKSGEPVTVESTEQPGDGLHVTRETAMPLGDGVFRVEYEVKE
jgi:hypothetical protein